jgi:hypothetical protein
MKLLGITNVNFDVIGQQLIRFSIPIRCCRKSGSAMVQYIRYLWTPRKPVIQFEGKHYTIFSLNLEYPRNYVVGIIKTCLNETCSTVHIRKNLSNMFRIQNGLKQGHTLSSFLFSFALRCTIRRVQENQEGLKLNGAHQILACADDINLVGETIDTIQKNTKPLLDTSKEGWSESESRETKYSRTSN